MKKVLLVGVLCLISLLCVGQSRISANAHLKGRKVVGSISVPTYKSNTEGVVVTQIKVDQYGNVTEAIPGAEGTTVTDKELWNAARNAAMKMHFDMSASAPALQTGTVSFSFGVSPSGQVAEPEFTPVKELVEIHNRGEYCIRARFVEAFSVSDLLFSVEEEDYIIPIRLVKNDLGAVNRFRALNLQKGDTLVIKGTLARISIRLDDYKGLEDAVILDKIDGPHQESGLSNADDNSDRIPFLLVEEKPSFKGGDANEFSKWVNANLKYPERAKKNNIQGRVTLRFDIKADGRLTNVSVLRGADPDLDQEAVRVVSSSPKWTPGKTRGTPVDVTYTFPVIFQLH